MPSGAPASTVSLHVGAKLLAATGWLGLALLTFGCSIRAGRRDGSLEFAS